MVQLFRMIKKGNNQCLHHIEKNVYHYKLFRIGVTDKVVLLLV